jgi:hypothetical protein
MTDENENKKKDDVSLYENLAARTAELLEEGKKTLDEAIKKAGEEISSAGKFSRERAEKIGAYIRRDLTDLGKQAEKTRDNLKKAVDPHRVAAGMQSILARILVSTAETLSDWAEKTEKQVEYKTGEITSPGTLTCKECGNAIHLSGTGHIPPCPKCHKTLFRKSY